MKSMKKTISVRSLKLDMGIAVLVYFFCAAFGSTLLSDEQMETYWLYVEVMSLSLFFILLSNQVQRNITAKRMLFVLGFIVLSSIFAFRAQTGIDDRTYERLFNAAGNMNWGGVFIKF